MARHGHQGWKDEEKKSFHDEKLQSIISKDLLSLVDDSRRGRCFERLLPLGGLVESARGFVELHETPHGFLQPWLTLLGKAPRLEGITGVSNLVFTLLQPSYPESRSGSASAYFSDPANCAQHASRIKCPPVVRKLLFEDGQALASRRFGLGKFPVAKQCERVFSQCAGQRRMIGRQPGAEKIDRIKATGLRSLRPPSASVMIAL